MNALWTYYWPVFAAGLVIGAIAGTIAFRRNRKPTLIIGAVVAIAAAALWHGPLGGADQFAARVERGARQALDYYEMTHVTAQLQRGPLSRRLILTGQADDFQHSELPTVTLRGADDLRLECLLPELCLASGQSAARAEVPHYQRHARASRQDHRQEQRGHRRRGKQRHARA